MRCWERTSAGPGLELEQEQGLFEARRGLLFPGLLDRAGQGLPCTAERGPGSAGPQQLQNAPEHVFTSEGRLNPHPPASACSTAGHALD